MDPTQLVAVAVLIPFTASMFVFVSAGGISERHHRHHDTYVISSTLTLTLVFAMVFMGALGVLLGWLCMVGVFGVDPAIALAFFDAYLVISFLYWILLRRYKVVTYEDHMDVTPFFGRTVSISYKSISAMEWTPSVLMRNSRNVRVYVGHRRRALLWSGLDLDQILIRIDRFDAIDSLST
jgi:hypothetical protein